MLADTLLPEAYAVEGVLTGPLVVAGFAVSLVPTIRPHSGVRVRAWAWCGPEGVSGSLSTW